MFRLVLLVSFIASGISTASTVNKVSAALLDTKVDSIEGFNVNIAAPFRYNDFVVGFRYALGRIRKAPESVFAKRTFEKVLNGDATVDADFNVADKVLDVEASWNSDRYGVGLVVNGDSTEKYKVKSVAAHKSVALDGNKIIFRGAYNIAKNLFSGSATADVESNKIDVAYNQADGDTLLTLTREIGDCNEISPSIALKTGKVAFGYKRVWQGGSLKTKVTPVDKMLNVEWKDDGVNGLWTTTADIPLEKTGGGKVSIKHDWKY